MSIALNKKKLLFALMCTLMMTMLMGMKTRAEEPENCKIIIGDSRVCSLICTLGLDESYIKTYESVEGAVWDAVLYKNGTWFIMCAQGGGYGKNGAYDRAAKRAIALYNSNDRFKNCLNVTFINMFAFNDLFVDYQDGRAASAYYLKNDVEYASMIYGCQKIYQFNAGPVDESGSTGWKYGITNDRVKAYNKYYVSTPAVNVVDFYTYLDTVGYKGAITDADGTGIHYDIATNMNIMNLLTVLN